MQLLTKEFLDNYPDVPSHMNQMAQFTFYRTYSRWLPELNRRETFKEAIARAVEYNVSISIKQYKENKFEVPFEQIKHECEKLFDNIFNLKQFLSGRTHWVGGASTGVANKFPLANFNCAFTEINNWEDFTDLFYLLLIGTGVGLSCTKEMANKLKPIRRDYTLLHSEYNPVAPEERLEKTRVNVMDNGYAKIYVSDSKEGWTEALGIFLKIITNTEFESIKNIKISYNSIRPRGERLKTFGGTASGYEPMKDMFIGIDKVFKDQMDLSLEPMVGSTVLGDDGIEYEEGKFHVRPIHILDVANLIGNNVVAGGVRRCLPEGALVHTLEGLKKIEDIEVGQKVRTADGYHEIVDWVEQGIQEVVEIRHQNGVFKCTPKHKMAVMTDFGKYEWKMAKDLLPGDKLTFVDAIIEGINTNFPNPKSDLELPTLDEDMAWIIGYIQGNGYINIKGGKVSISIPSNQPRILEKSITLLEKLSNRRIVHKPVDGNYHVIETKNKKLAEYMFEHVKQANKEMDVPSFILEGTIRIRESYLAGLYDADGTSKNKPIIALISIYPDFMRQVQAVYHSLGILTNLQLKREEKDNWKTLYSLSVVGEKPKMKFVEMMERLNTKLDNSESKSIRSQYSNGYPREWIVGKLRGYSKVWSSNSKQMTVETYERITGEQQHLIPVEVIEIIYSGEKVQTYDISVKDAHEFVCEGILTHNTAEIFLCDEDDWEVILAKYGINGIWDMEAHKALGEKLYALDVLPSWWEDMEVFEAKKSLTHRYMSNNSVAFKTKPEREMLNTIFTILKNVGEPGFVNMEEANRRRPNAKGMNPCCEILLDNKQVCNLTTINVMAFVKDGELDYNGLMEAQALSVRAGIRMTCIDLELPEWNAMHHRDRLIGASLTGWKDAMEELNYEPHQEEELLGHLGKVALDTSILYSHVLRIPVPLLSTTVKPEGTLSQVANGVSSGLHVSHAPYFIRRIRINANDPLAKVAIELGWRTFPDDTDDLSTAKTWVVEFPVKSPVKKTRATQTLQEQFDTYFTFQHTYTDHNSSNTITVREDEWIEAEQIVWENWDNFVGVSFIPYSGGNYKLMPYEECTEEVYNIMSESMKPFSLELLYAIEKEETDKDVENMQSCDSGVCPIF